MAGVQGDIEVPREGTHVHIKSVDPGFRAHLWASPVLASAADSRRQVSVEAGGNGMTRRFIKSPSAIDPTASGSIVR